MNYKIVIEKPALKFLEKQTQKDRERILRAVYALPDNGDIRKMSGYETLWRLRVGTFRVLYTVENNILTVRVLSVGNRGDVYK